ncbi:uncharacterized protein LOC121755388 [Salvia splendens]|uniref:uncharacterized protein LOC121755388 n=1 Tax=Salvia splendens TaxID=180675 RepID=UPI001C258D0A|nr:uncharacterized protein LOC121755388 [Salvia splendens]
MTEVHTRGGTVGADFRTITGLGRESKGCYLQLCRVLAGGEPAGWSLLLSVQHSLTFLQDHGVAELGAELPSLVANCRARCRTAVLGGELPSSVPNCRAWWRTAELGAELPCLVAARLAGVSRGVQG